MTGRRVLEHARSPGRGRRNTRSRNPSCPWSRRSVEARRAARPADSVYRASAASAVRSCPIAAAAASPWPTTSPTVSATRPSGSEKTSYQSPPTSSASLAAS